MTLTFRDGTFRDGSFPELSPQIQTHLQPQPHLQPQRESEVRSYSRSFPATFTTAAGSELTDESGRTYIDFLGGCSALNYGHNDPDMVAALIDYLHRGGVAHGLDMATNAKIDFTATFAELILAPRGLDYVLQFCGPTGTNAVEAAMKLARKCTGRSQIVAFTNGFHGVTAGALAATGNQHHRMGPSTTHAGIMRALYDGYLGSDVDTAALLDQLLSDPSSGFDPPAAILLETVQGEGGLNVASDDWLRAVAEIANRHGALLIIDDIQAGCGRTGSFFSFESAGIKPDLVTLSKSLSGFGLPMSLVLIDPSHDVWNPGEHNGTFRGNNLAFVTATKTLRKFWSDDVLMSDVDRRAAIVCNTLSAMQTVVPDSVVKGRGLMLGLDVRDGAFARDICRRSFDAGLIIETSGAQDQVVKILAPLTTPDALLIEGLDRLESALRVAITDR